MEMVAVPKEQLLEFVRAAQRICRSAEGPRPVDISDLRVRGKLFHEAWRETMGDAWYALPDDVK